MRIIAKKMFDDAAKVFPSYATSIMDVYNLLKRHNYDSPDQMRQVFGTLDNFKLVDKWWVIDIAGNNLRLVAYIDFANHLVFSKYILSHSEYDKLTKKVRKG